MTIEILDGPELLPAIGAEVRHAEWGRVKLLRRYETHCNVLGSDGITRGVPCDALLALDANVVPISSLMVSSSTTNFIAVEDPEQPVLAKINYLTANQFASIASVSKVFARKLVDSRPSQGYESFKQLVEIARKNGITSDLKGFEGLDYEARSS